MVDHSLDRLLGVNPEKILHEQGPGCSPKKYTTSSIIREHILALGVSIYVMVYVRIKNG